MKELLKLRVNGDEHEIYVEPWKTLLDVLTRDLMLMGPRIGCLSGYCGSCTVLIDGKAVKSCLILAPQADGKEVTTIEGLADGDKLHPLQQAFIDYFALQCGYCTPGMILTAKALLDENPRPTEAEVKAALRGNLCRCTGYLNITKAVMAVKGKAKA